MIKLAKSIELQIQEMKMILSLNNLLKEKNINNAINVNFGLKKIKDAVIFLF